MHVRKKKMHKETMPSAKKSIHQNVKKEIFRIIKKGFLAQPMDEEGKKFPPLKIFFFILVLNDLRKRKRTHKQKDHNQRKSKK